MLPYAANAAEPAAAPMYAEVNFDSRFLFGAPMDLSRFSQGNAVLPGVYAADIRVNGQRVGRFDVQFQTVDATGRTEPCFTRRELETLGIDSARAQAASVGGLPQTPAESTGESGECLALSVAVPGSRAYMDLGDLVLDLSVPQAFMYARARGWVDPARWDNGATVGLLDYSLNAYSSRPNHGASDFSNMYLGLTSGVNLGPWRLRQRSTKSWSNRGNSSWNSLETYAQRGIEPWRSQLVLGDSYTSGELFDTTSLRGVRVFSDDRMLPDSMRSYAPVVRGIADTNAVVTVRQGGRVLHEENVSAGPFELSDLPASGYGGDLEVTVQEADGRQSTFSVPFASVPLLLREGLQRYSLGIGKYRNSEFDSEPLMFEGTYQYGLTDAVTAYAGSQASEGYTSLMLGSAINTPVGAFSLDVTGARTQVSGSTSTGLSTRVNYANMLSDTGTRFSMAGYRYSTSNFYSLRDALFARAGSDESSRTWYDYRVRERFQINVSQPVGDRGNVFITGSRQNYWRADSGSDLQFQVGYSSSFRTVGYSIYAQRIRSGESATLSNQVMLTLSIPLGRSSTDTGPRFNSLSSTITRSSNGDHVVQASASGTGGTDVPVSFGLTASTAQTGGSSSSTNTLGGYGSYRAPFGTYTANASVGNQMQQASVGVRGALVAHAGGVTAGPSLGRAAALVQAKGATGARLINGQGAEIDGNGYALVPALTPYRVNSVMLDPAKLGMDVELGSTSEEVVPTLDSIVLVELRTTQGRPVLLRLRRDGAEAVPLGANVFQEEGQKALGTVGQAGTALLRGMAEQGAVRVRWGEGADQQCRAAYRLPTETAEKRPADRSGIVRLQVECRPLEPIAQAVPEKASDHEM
ncbi:fimbria/pilus outer membrane usher protein [Achromobacter seleniivolatilans]